MNSYNGNVSLPERCCTRRLSHSLENNQILLQIYLSQQTGSKHMSMNSGRRCRTEIQTRSGMAAFGTPGITEGDVITPTEPQ